jgi:hypothetical protein
MNEAIFGLNKQRFKDIFSNKMSITLDNRAFS